MNRIRRITKHTENPYPQPEGAVASPPEEDAEQPSLAPLTDYTNGSPVGAEQEPVQGASASIDADVLPDAQSAEETPAPAEVSLPEPSEAGHVDVEGLTAQLPDERVVYEEGQTAPLPQPTEHEDLTPLPGNAVVASRYVVQTQLHQSPDRNLYRVGARRMQKCPECGRLSSHDSVECEHCGAHLSDQPPAEYYLMAESFHPQALMQDPSIMDLRLYHPNLVPVVDFFEYTPFGRARYYAVAEPRQGVRLSQLSMPRPGLQVLGWALQLADALDYLHSSGVVGAGAEADDVLVQGDMASLASLQNAHSSPDNDNERVQAQSMDLAKLAATMYEAYTGQPVTMGPQGVLPMPSQSPEKVGAAFRAAIEPVQGISPPISAGQWRDMLSGALLSVAELEQPGRPVDFTAACLSDVGQVRDQNQDSFCSSEFMQSSVERPMKLGLYVVADGMGGHKGGEVASAIAAQAFSAEVMGKVVAPLAASTGNRLALTNEQILQNMVRAVQLANERIYKARDSRQNDMGTTIVAALITGGKAYIVNVGDSRLYFYTRHEEAQEQSTGQLDATAPLATGTVPLQRNGSAVGVVPVEEAPPAQESGFMLTQISVDHSLVHRLVELGQLDPEEAKVHPHRNFIYRSLGGPPPIEVDTFVRSLRPGDRILLCSDGLNSMIEDSEIEGVLASEPDPDVAAQRLIELANNAGGHDNITTIVIDVGDYLPLPEHSGAFAGL